MDRRRKNRFYGTVKYFSRKNRACPAQHRYVIHNGDYQPQQNLQRCLANVCRQFYHEDKRVALYRATGETGALRPFAAPNFDVPAIEVSTENDYSPSKEEIVH
jgi:hypothetical protein